MIKTIGMTEEFINLIETERQKEFDKPSFSRTFRQLALEGLVARGVLERAEVPARSSRGNSLDKKGKLEQSARKE